MPQGTFVYYPKVVLFGRIVFSLAHGIRTSLCGQVRQIEFGIDRRIRREGSLFGKETIRPVGNIVYQRIASGNRVFGREAQKFVVGRNIVVMGISSRNGGSTSTETDYIAIEKELLTGCRMRHAEEERATIVEKGFVIYINCISTMPNEGIYAFSHPACNVVKNEKSLIVIGDDIVF